MYITKTGLSSLNVAYSTTYHEFYHHVMDISPYNPNEVAAYKFETKYLKHSTPSRYITIDNYSGFQYFYINRIFNLWR
jgi:hypothetical protein